MKLAESGSRTIFGGSYFQLIILTGNVCKLLRMHIFFYKCLCWFFVTKLPEQIHQLAITKLCGFDTPGYGFGQHLKIQAKKLLLHECKVTTHSNFPIRGRKRQMEWRIWNLLIFMRKPTRKYQDIAFRIKGSSFLLLRIVPTAFSLVFVLYVFSLCLLRSRICS